MIGIDGCVRRGGDSLPQCAEPKYCIYSGNPPSNIGAIPCNFRCRYSRPFYLPNSLQLCLNKLGVQPFSLATSWSLNSSMSFRSSFMLFVFSISVFAVTTVALTPISTESSPKCYFIDGSFDPAGGPCYGNVGASMCCYDGEECVSLSGLCLATPNGLAGQYDNGSSIWRRSCTDVTWQDPACLAIAYSEHSLLKGSIFHVLVKMLRTMANGTGGAQASASNPYSSATAQTEASAREPKTMSIARAVRTTAKDSSQSSATHASRRAQ